MSTRVTLPTNICKSIKAIRSFCGEHNKCNECPLFMSESEASRCLLSEESVDNWLIKYQPVEQSTTILEYTEED